MRHWVHFNAKQWPLVVFETPVRFSGLQLERYCADFEYCLGLGEPFAAVLDLTASCLPSPEVRGELIRFRLRVRTQGLLVAEAIVAPERPMRAWAAPLAGGFQDSSQTSLFERMADAVPWARHQLLAAGSARPMRSVRKASPAVEPPLDATSPERNTA